MASPQAPAVIASRIIDVPVDDEMRDSFMPYALSVTTSRAIPDVRDGLKPVQRRILYVMNDLGLRPGTPFRKSAGVVGEVMGKYHPHGDSAIYEAMVRMGQSFSMSVPLVAPKGNFGSLDDPPAAYRYTEARLTEAAMTMVAGIDEDTVDFRPNFDGEREEPVCLPAALPNLLVNGATGIAVGMATNMPPHNLTEVAAAIRLVLTQRRPKPTVDELMELIPGPDFPGGAILIDDGTLREAYETGRGTVRVRARCEIEPISSRRQGIVVTELPYMVGPERVQGKIRELVLAGRLEGVAAVNDLSDRNHGLRLVIECKAGVSPHSLLNKLYRLTPLEESFGINNVALVDGVPCTLGLYDMCSYYITHRLDVIIRRTQYRLRKGQEREHIVLGLLIALDNIEQVIRIIRGSVDVPEARAELISQLALSEIQANHILDMQLRRLTALEVDKLREELGELQKDIAGYQKILGSEQRQRSMVLRELDEVANEFGSPRRTHIMNADDVVVIDDSPIAAVTSGDGDGSLGDIATLVTLSTSGLLGRQASDAEFVAKPGRHDVLAVSVDTTAFSQVFAVTDRGRLLSVRVRDIPEMVRGSRGASVTEMFALGRGERVVGLSGHADAPLAIITKAGIAKRIEGAVIGATRSGNPVINLKDDDRVIAAFLAPDDAEFAMLATDGQVLRTSARGVSVQGAAAGGVAGMKLKGGATIVAAGLIEFGTLVVGVTDEGTAKVTDGAEIPSKGRATGGVRVLRMKGFETSLSYGWFGKSAQSAAIVADPNDPKKPDPSPVELPLGATRRDGPAVDLAVRILALGEYRLS
jgi:DNA gyrase subunit A